MNRAGRFVAARVPAGLALALGVAAAALAVTGCNRLRRHRAPPVATLVAARVAAAPVLDGELEEPFWRDAQRTPRFVDATTGRDGPPHSEARAAWDDAALYVGLYAADIDVEPADRLGVVVRANDVFVLDVDPQAHLHWHPPGAPDVAVPEGVAAGVDVDGSLATPADDDEELVVEARIPWRALGLASAPETVRIDFFRRDAGRTGPLRTLAWVPWRDHAVGDRRGLGALRLAR